MTLERWKRAFELTEFTQRDIKKILADWENQVTVLQDIVDRQSSYIDDAKKKIDTIRTLLK